MAATLFHGGTVHTGDPARPVCDALLVEAGTVSALGDDARERGRHAEHVDLAGGALIPSFGDGHAHPLIGGLGLRGAPIRECTSVDEIVAAVAAFAQDHPDVEWIRGDAFSPTLAPEGRFDAEWLDRAVPDRPVLLRTMDHHTAWVNSEALRRAGITAATPDPAGGEILRRPDGAPLGTLREFGALALVNRVAPDPSLADQVAALRDTTRRFAAAGITWVHDAYVEEWMVDAWVAAAEEQALRVRANLALLMEPGTWRDRLPGLDEERRRVEKAGAGQVTVRSVKFLADGVVEAGTAALLDPYCDCPTSHGLPNWEPSELAEAMAAVDALGFQAHVHAIGDAGVRTALDAVEETARGNGPRDRRPTIAHAQLIDPGDLPRFAALGVVATMQPLWSQLDPLMTELTLPRIGEHRGARQYQLASLVRSGAHLAMGSDWPVTAFEPLAGVATAVSRQTPHGVPDDGWLPDERVTTSLALAAYSAGSAYQAFEENEWGRLRVGMRADLVQLAEDPLTIPPAQLRDLPVAGTWLAGQRTH